MAESFMVLTNSPHAYDKRILARVEPQRGMRCQIRWTDVFDEAWKMDRETATEIASKLSYNNPRISRTEKAMIQMKKFNKQ